MNGVWCVHAEFSTYTSHFVEGGYVAIGWLPGIDLPAIRTRDALSTLQAGVPRRDKQQRDRPASRADRALPARDSRR